MRRRPSLALLLGALSSWAMAPSFGQSATAPAPAARLAAMKKLDAWVGEWKGSGWSAMGADQRFEFTLVEKVERKVGGTVLAVEGRGVRKTERGEEVVTHDGLALVYYDDKTSQYRWHGHDAPWGAIEAEAKLVDGGLEWSFRVEERNATMRFTIHFDEKQWHEVGDVSVDGKTWIPIMEVNLARQK